jgi:hypothetical protein
MNPANSTPDYHSAFCLARDWRASLFCVLFSGWQVLVRFIAIGKPFPVEHEPFLYIVGVIGVVVFLVQQMVRLKCVRERIVFGVAIAGLAFHVARLLSPSVATYQTFVFQVALLAIWALALGTSLSLFWSAMRQSGKESRSKKTLGRNIP